jgi:penicillin-binding protein 2
MPWKRFLRRRKLSSEIHPDEIFMDSSNVPSFDTDQFEGRIERPISRRSLWLFFGAFTLIAIALLSRAWVLEVWNGKVYAELSERNRLSNEYIFADRGTIIDRLGVELAYDSHEEGKDFPHRVYAEIRGLGQVLGYAKAPTKDSSGFYYQDRYIGVEGLEKTFDAQLQGTNGLKISETDARGKVVSESTIAQPVQGQTVTLSLDAKLSQAFYDAIADRVEQSGFRGGAGAMMDIQTGEIVALTSYPTYDPQIMTDRSDQAAIKGYLSDTRQPFLNRITAGLFTPGSIVKPFLAIGALHEKIIDPNKQILSTGSISVPNPYFPDKPSIFRDWKAHGWVDMRHAISVSSDVYFYEVGGGYPGQKGIGIDKWDEYARMFGMAQKTGIGSFTEAAGTIPTPEWKKEHFPDDPWRLGDTYNSSIGQYGFQVTPLQMLRAVAGLASDGTLVTPTIIKDAPLGKTETLPFTADEYTVVHEGMRLSALEGTAKALNVSYATFGAKTGTAELDSQKKFVNSWVMGFFPYDKPRYAFIILLEHGPYKNLFGAAGVMRVVADWMNVYRQDMLQGKADL